MVNVALPCSVVSASILDRILSRWSPGRRSDDASRAVAAYLARRRFGYPAGEVAKALGYRGAGSVTRAVARVEPGNERLKHTAANLERKSH